MALGVLKHVFIQCISDYSNVVVTLQLVTVRDVQTLEMCLQIKYCRKYFQCESVLEWRLRSIMEERLGS